MHATQLMHSPIAFPLKYNEGHPNVTLPEYFKEGEEKVSLISELLEFTFIYIILLCRLQRLSG